MLSGGGGGGGKIYVDEDEEEEMSLTSQTKRMGAQGSGGRQSSTNVAPRTRQQARSRKRKVATSAWKVDEIFQGKQRGRFTFDKGVLFSNLDAALLRLNKKHEEDA